MKICICVNGRAHEGGLTSFINSVCDGLRTAGHQVDVVSLFGLSEYRKTKNKFINSVDKILVESPIKTFFLYVLNKIIITVYLFFYYPFKKWDVVFAPDAAAVNSSWPLYLLFNVPITLIVQGSIPLGLADGKKIKKGDLAWNYFLREEARAYQRAQAVIANSEYTKHCILSINDKVENIHIIRNLANENIIFRDDKVRRRKRKELKLPPDAFVVLFVGRLNEVKGVHYLLSAFKSVVKKRENIFLVFAGDGPEKTKLEKEIKTAGLEKKVFLLGSIPYEKINNAYNLGDVLVVPSITLGEMKEPLGIVALEGMAAQIPVIAFAVGGLAETIKDGYNGILLPEKNIQKLAEAILEVKENKSLAKKLTTNGLREIEENYTTKVTAEKLSRIFQSTLSSAQWKRKN